MSFSKSLRSHSDNQSVNADQQHQELDKKSDQDRRQIDLPTNDKTLNYQNKSYDEAVTGFSYHYQTPEIQRRNMDMDILQFFKEIFNQNGPDKTALLRIEFCLINLALDQNRYFMLFPPMSPFHRLLVHNVAEFFQMSHSPDSGSVLVTLTKNTRIPDRPLAILCQTLGNQPSGDSTGQKYSPFSSNSEMEPSVAQIFKQLQNKVMQMERNNVELAAENCRLTKALNVYAQSLSVLDEKFERLNQENSVLKQQSEALKADNEGNVSRKEYDEAAADKELLIGVLEALKEENEKLENEKFEKQIKERPSLMDVYQEFLKERSQQN